MKTFFQKGIGLIEVLIAGIVFAVGIQDNFIAKYFLLYLATFRHRRKKLMILNVDGVWFAV